MDAPGPVAPTTDAAYLRATELFQDLDPPALAAIAGAARRRPVRNPWPERFIRMAYGWLLIAAVLNRAYSGRAWAGSPVPHAFVASYHHALTVGFISMMILGMSMRLVPVFIGAMNRRPGLAAAVFVLITLGNATRVVSESLAYVAGGGFYLAMGVSGLIEVAGLTVYAVALWRALDQPSYGQAPTRRPASPEAARPLPAGRGRES
jgi:uncharacterized protein involved in response to NO